MRKTLFRTLLITLFLTNACIGFAQVAGITSGAIYTIKSKAINKILNVTNSSMDNAGNVDIWTDTKSDAQRWIVTHVSDSTYTLMNVASGKYLHTGAIVANTTTSNVDQYPLIGNYKWILADAGDGSFLIKVASNNAFSLNLVTGTADGTNVNSAKFTGSNSQKWTFQMETAQPTAPGAAAADLIYNAWKTNYYDTRASNEVIKGEWFWGVAEIMEIIDDAYEVTGDPKYKTMFNNMYNRFISVFGSDWMWNEYNDDITWMVIACTRAYHLTGTRTYLTKAKEQFDKMYARANTTLYEGGLIWKEGTVTKNACINGPAMVACCYLAEATGDMTYYDKAIYLYDWSKKYLFNPLTGKVNDAYDGTIHDWSSTYNQGTYLGAAMMLYNHTKDANYLKAATNIANYTKNTMYSSRTMNNEEGNDLSGFKGIFMRYARRYVTDGQKAEFIPWLQLNAKVAYNNRTSKNIIHTMWGTRTPESKAVAAFSASTAMSLLFNCPYSTTIIKDAYSTIQAENFNYLKGIYAEANAEGNMSLTHTLADYYTGYSNVDFGVNGATAAQFRISSVEDGGSIEIRLGGTSGTLIGTATVPNTGDWSTYTTVNCPITLTKGLQNIYLVYKGTSLNICKLDYFTFVPDPSAIDQNELSGKDAVTLYPNPVTTELNVDCGDQNIESVSISDLNGRQVYKINDKTAGTKTIDVSGLPTGMYFVTVQTDQQMKIVRKFIK